MSHRLSGLCCAAFAISCGSAEPSKSVGARPTGSGLIASASASASTSVPLLVSDPLGPPPGEPAIGQGPCWALAQPTGTDPLPSTWVVGDNHPSWARDSTL